MFGFSGAIKFYYCPTPISMRKSFDGLAGAVEEYIQQEYMPSEPHGEGDIAVELWKKLEPGEK